MVHKGRKAYLKNEIKQQALDSAEQTNSPPSKKAKIIVRNLPFKNLSEESIEDFFKEYGDVESVNLLRKNDGKFVGCAFVQFKKVSSAAKAIRHGNQKEMSGRKIIVDWALPKKVFLEKVQKFEENLYLDNNNSEISLNNEKIDFVIDKKPNKWNVDDEGSEPDMSEEDDDIKGAETRDEENEEEDSDDTTYSDEKDDSNEKFKISNKKQNKKTNNDNADDVEDGKTVFVRNIPFSATNEDLKNCVESYGPIDYALICIDKLTEHSKGTGFVKFKDKESASQCVKDSTKIYLEDNPLTVTLALSKTKLESKKNSKKVVKDSRNLYLIREGIVIAGSKAAAGVSAGDMAKRLQLEQWKNQILKNLNMFVSRTRLVVHNLPPFYDDNKLRDLFLKYSNPKAVIKEAKVMYDKKKLDSSGRGASKEVGFVSFSKHEDALEALRNINNNPAIFTPKKRPIVAFSIENKAVINSKLKRIEKSRIKLGINDQLPDKLSKLNRKQRRFLRRREKFIQMRKVAKKQKECLGNSETEEVQKGKTTNSINEEGSKKKRKFLEDSNKPIKKLKTNDYSNENATENDFTGVLSESGKKIKLRSRFRLKNQASIHNQTLKTERRKKRERERKKLSLRKPMKEKKGKPKLMDDANLSKLLKKHRESVQQSSVMKKWYDN